jgi:hypothetical protein
MYIYQYIYTFSPYISYERNIKKHTQQKYLVHSTVEFISTNRQNNRRNFDCTVFEKNVDIMLYIILIYIPDHDFEIEIVSKYHHLLGECFVS